MDRTERILSLIASLLDAREPVPVETIRGWFQEDYADVSDVAFERKFERDKADIVELGIPLRFARGEDGTVDGYVVDRSETYLPELDFDVQELAVLYTAGNGLLTQTAFPYHRDLERAMDKVALRVQPDRAAQARTAARRVLMNHPLRQPSPAVERYLELASDAIAARQRLRITYHTLYSGEITERDVDPYGLRCWHGSWALIGYCHARQDVRIFSLHRFRGADAIGDSDAFAVPEGFSVANWQVQPPWRYRLHEPIPVTLECESSRSWLVEEQLETPGSRGADWDTFELEVTNEDGFVEWVLRQGPSVRVLSPAGLRTRVVDALRAVVNLYEGTAP